jgi:hypothetical protein
MIHKIRIGGNKKPIDGWVNLFVMASLGFETRHFIP